MVNARFFLGWYVDLRRAFLLGYNSIFFMGYLWFFMKKLLFVPVFLVLFSGIAVSSPMPTDLQTAKRFVRSYDNQTGAKTDTCLNEQPMNLAFCAMYSVKASRNTLDRMGYSYRETIRKNSEVDTLHPQISKTLFMPLLAVLKSENGEEMLVKEGIFTARDVDIIKYDLGIK